MANPHVTAANRYAREVVAGKIVACKWVKLACKRHLDDLESAKKKTSKYFFDADAADDVCAFIELLPHTKGKWAKTKELIVLQPWQKFIFCVLFGWKIRKNERRRFRKAYIAVPRKNGKSILAAGIALYMFAADGEFGAEVYSGATTEKQAWEVFRPAKQMIERTPELADAIGAEVWAKMLLTPADGSKFEPVIGKPGDGSSPSCAIVDEYHEHDTSELVDTMETGMGARDQPLLVEITTAGYNIAGPCYDQELDAKKVLEGALEQDELFAIIYTVDEEDAWDDPKALRKANPNMGISVDQDFLLSQQRQAVQSAAKQTRFKTKHLNIWCSAKTAWMNMIEWAKCADPTLRREQFIGDKNWKALDLASRSDICADVDCFIREIEGKTHYYLFGKYALPETAIESATKFKNSYTKWVIEGFLDQHEGAEIDFSIVRDLVLADMDVFAPQEVVFDPWRAAQLAQELMKEGAVAVEFRQTVQNMSLPMKELESAVKAGRLHHDGNPVLTWMMSNVVAKLDAKDNIYPRKEKQENKIDGVVAAIMAVGRAMLAEPDQSDDWISDILIA
ncbi:terminase large subunit [Collimonas sp.]|jgi:phage terminase large subunit-like protein|uniref:terminase large subunit n=1 Tax=Collimonas sp. TaxID=1963772 RepID=UPI002BA7E951|nr:terminase TerL endonuclease subunit [Collimonas sp.]HWX01448.1 terminase TerL endonuclease subunit [Collimonas sp.]